MEQKKIPGCNQYGICKYNYLGWRQNLHQIPTGFYRTDPTDPEAACEESRRNSGRVRVPEKPGPQDFSAPRDVKCQHLLDRSSDLLSTRDSEIRSEPPQPQICSSRWWAAGPTQHHRACVCALQTWKTQTCRAQFWGTVPGISITLMLILQLVWPENSHPGALNRQLMFSRSGMNNRKS